MASIYESFSIQNVSTKGPLTLNKKYFHMYVKYINSNMYAEYGNNGNNEYLEKRLFTTF